MPRIRLLTASTVNKIAAGEVIERPASVVKELMENAIDAGSSKIILEIKDAGKTLIKIIDNGCGIEKEDAPLVFERHATSKMDIIEDIYAIATMGFRGEALSSIAAVANVEVLTCTKEGDSAALLIKRPSEDLVVKEGARAKGTTISVSDLFANIPVRRQFLSTDTAELGRITNVFTALSVAHPEISFRYICDGKEKANYQATENPLNRIRDAYGSALADSLLSGKYSDEILEVTVFFSNLDLTRANRTGQSFFVNRRLIENKNMERGLRIGYRDLLPGGRFPIAFVFVRINPDEIDVNVHPAKREIRFADEERIHRAVGKCITEGFRAKSIVRPSAADSENALNKESITSTQDTLPGLYEPKTGEQKSTFSFGASTNAHPAPGHVPASGSESKANPFQELPVQPFVPQQSSEAKIGVGEQFKNDARQYLIPYFQLHNTYILCQIKNGLLMIDQHVAHERILYEKALKGLSAGERPVTQQLLFPVMLELTAEQKLMVDTFFKAFEQTGFALRSLSGNCVVVDGVPAAHKDQPVKQMVLEMVDELTKNSFGPNDYDKHYASSYACGAAIKAGQPLSLEEINYLVDMLFQCENPYTCPH
ncbi:MAG: DNA mismatch repair endonuclease MutL, partial [Fibrobacteres bacterium]|nr:DNA mismatch repair endonuclease MutL [Fibrobacterota bacterium]